jgi:myo-inositol-1(or 4)-monophosphatase
VPEFDELLEIARHAATEAGVALAAHRPQWGVIASEQGREVKIDADTRAEELILRALEREAPFPVISEEVGWVREDEQSAGLVWAVDPLDGSVNYLRGYPHCAVSIALLKNGSPVLGVVNCFVLGENFSGMVGKGADLNGQPIQVSEIASPLQGIIQTGVPSRASDESMRLFEARLKTWRKVRMIGSAATALAYVAAGRAEAYRESGSMIWDVAAGCALVAAAGGIVSIAGETLAAPQEVAACNGIVALPD